MLSDIISPVKNFFAMLVRYCFLCVLCLGSSLYLFRNQCSCGHGHPTQLSPLNTGGTPISHYKDNRTTTKNINFLQILFYCLFSQRTFHHFPSLGIKQSSSMNNHFDAEEIMQRMGLFNSTAEHESLLHRSFLHCFLCLRL